MNPSSSTTSSTSNPKTTSKEGGGGKGEGLSYYSSVFSSLSSSKSCQQYESIDTIDILRLIQTFLLEHGYIETFYTLQREYAASVSSSSSSSKSKNQDQVAAGGGALSSSSSSFLGLPGILQHYHSNIQYWCNTGQWGNILSALSTIDKQLVLKQQQQHQPQKNKNKEEEASTTTTLQSTIGAVHEMAILELAEVGSIDVAYSVLRLVEDELNTTTTTNSNTTMKSNMLSKSRNLQQILAALAATNRTTTNTNTGTSNTSTSTTIGSNNPTTTTKTNQHEERYLKLLCELYNIDIKNTTSSNNTDTIDTADTDTMSTSQKIKIQQQQKKAIENAKQKRRLELSKQLCNCIPIIPKNRLLCLLQQSLKWQAYTGQLPYIKEFYYHSKNNDNDENNNNNDDDDDDNSTSSSSSSSSSASSTGSDNNDHSKKKKSKKKSKKKKKKKKKKKHQNIKNYTKKFDLVMGEINEYYYPSDDDDDDNNNNNNDITKKRKKYYDENIKYNKKKKQKLISTFKHMEPYSTISLGKSVTVECCIVLPDIITSTDTTTGSSNRSSSSTTTSSGGIITGSSDGLIEVWDSKYNYTKLRTDLLYQQQSNDDDDNNNNNVIVGHQTSITSMCISNDQSIMASCSKYNGTIKIWNFKTGKILRKIIAIPSTTTTSGGGKNNSSSPSITCIQFCRDATRIICGTTNGICREFGIRTTNMLNEFIGHTSYIHTCHYLEEQQHHNNNNDNTNVLIITGSADGTVRLWNSKTSIIVRTFCMYNNPSLSTTTGSNDSLSISSSIIIDPSLLVDNTTSTIPGIHTIIPILYTSSKTTSTTSTTTTTTTTTKKKQSTDGGSMMIIVPRSTQAVLVNSLNGIIYQIYTIPTRVNTSSSSKKNKNSSSSSTGRPLEQEVEEEVFVTACTNLSNEFLYCVSNKGHCYIYDIESGICETTINDFTYSSTSKQISSSSSSDKTQREPELSSIIQHPNKSLLIAYSNDKTQKRGIVTIWK